ncbi:MAG: hypothetical protein HYR96_06940 [Deltaproteobacteria bacterium]|nr:hypothetical protein [Deltaproteobacteria bacterium]
MANSPAWSVLTAVLLALLAGDGYGAQEKRVLVHGHRGSRGTHPENTLPAFEEAIEAGAEVLELDLQLSKDGVPIIWHDFELSPKICQKAGATLPVAIHTLTMDEIKTFDCGSLSQSRFPDQKRIEALHLSTLDGLFQWVAGLKKAGKLNRPIQFNIETKMTGTEPADPSIFAKTAIDIIRKAGVLDSTILQSFDFRTLVAARKIEPKLRLSALFETKGDYCLEVKKIGAQILSLEFSRLTQAVVKQCHDMGIEIAPWTLNTEREWKSAIEMGVDAIITDYPRRLKTYLATHQ